MILTNTDTGDFVKRQNVWICQHCIIDYMTTSTAVTLWRHNQWYLLEGPIILRAMIKHTAMRYLMTQYQSFPTQVCRNSLQILTLQEQKKTTINCVGWNRSPHRLFNISGHGSLRTFMRRSEIGHKFWTQVTGRCHLCWRDLGSRSANKENSEQATLGAYSIVGLVQRWS